MGGTGLFWEPSGFGSEGLKFLDPEGKSNFASWHSFCGFSERDLHLVEVVELGYVLLELVLAARAPLAPRRSTRACGGRAATRGPTHPIHYGFDKRY